MTGCNSYLFFQVSSKLIKYWPGGRSSKPAGQPQPVERATNLGGGKRGGGVLSLQQPSCGILHLGKPETTFEIAGPGTNVEEGLHTKPQTLLLEIPVPTHDSKFDQWSHAPVSLLLWAIISSSFFPELAIKIMLFWSAVQSHGDPGYWYLLWISNKSGPLQIIGRKQESVI